MDRAELKEYIRTHFGIVPDHPWVKYPDFEVFRHGENQKWFALIMNVPQEKLGLPGNERLDVVNFKCDPVLLGSFLGEKGVLPCIPHEQGKLDNGSARRKRRG